MADPQIIPETTCLLIVDVQRGFVNQHTRHIPEKVEQLQKKYTHIAASRFYNPEHSSFRKLVRFEKIARNTAEFAFAFTPRPDTLVIDKPAYTCLRPPFERYLIQHKIAEVHLAGMDTDMCVMKTAVDLFERERVRPVVLARHCASTAGPAHHAAALDILRRYIGRAQVV